jgi:hypothetical protein
VDTVVLKRHVIGLSPPDDHGLDVIAVETARRWNMLADRAVQTTRRCDGNRRAVGIEPNLDSSGRRVSACDAAKGGGREKVDVPRGEWGIHRRRSLHQLLVAKQ